MINSLLPLFQGILLNENQKLDKMQFKDQIWMMFEFM